MIRRKLLALIPAAALVALAEVRDAGAHRRRCPDCFEFRCKPGDDKFPCPRGCFCDAGRQPGAFGVCKRTARTRRACAHNGSHT